MASVLEWIRVVNNDKEKAMAVLNGLPSRYETIITALDAIGYDDPSFTFDKVRKPLAARSETVVSARKNRSKWRNYGLSQPLTRR